MTTAYRTILYEKMRKGALVTMNRPEALNGLSPEMIEEISDALTQAEADPEVRAVVLTGAGRAFSAGYDMGGSRPRPPSVWPYGLPEGSNVAKELDALREVARSHSDKRMQLWDLTKPVIAAVSGWCMAGASWYALTAHITIAANDAVFAQPEVRMSSNTNFFWTLLAGYKHALRYGLTGDHIDAQEALRIGLVNQVVPKDRLLDECFKLVERIALVAPETVKINLQVATKGLEMMGLRNAIELNVELTTMTLSKREEFHRPLEEARQRGGLRAFLQARDGPFQPEPFGPRSRPRT